MTQSGLAPRRAALTLLNDVTIDARLLSEVLPRRLRGLPAEDRARAQRLAVTTLRVLDRSDRMLGPFLRQKPPVPVLNVLRLGVAEICEDGSAAHGVVNDLVELVRKDAKNARLSGLVNAVLRKVARDAEKWSALPVPRLPKWLRKPLLADYGKHVVTAIETAHFKGAPLDLSVKQNAVKTAETLGGQVLPSGSVRLQNFGQVSALPGYDNGDWWVQDAAAALPARILDVQPGETVLDLCAAPGGKTLQLAAAGATVTALDISETRLQRLTDNLSRTGLAANVVTADALDYTAPAFDAILLDAPCSATGTIRRHPDLPYAKDGSDFPGLFTLQASLIDKALDLLKPGGRLVYCTCSLLIDEGEEQVRDAVLRHPDLVIDRDAVTLDFLDADWIGDEGGLRLRPDYWADTGGMDGFYIVMMRKPA